MLWELEREGSFKHPKQVLKLRDNKIFTILLSKMFIWTIQGSNLRFLSTVKNKVFLHAEDDDQLAIIHSIYH